MKLSDQPYIPFSVPPVPVQVPAVTTSWNSGGAAQGLKVELDPNKNSESSATYPMATDEEIRNRDERALRSRGRHKAPNKPEQPNNHKDRNKPEGPDKPKDKNKPEGPGKPAGTSIPKKQPGGANGTSDAANNMKVIDDLHKKNVFPPLSSELASSARRSFVMAGVSTLVNVPFNVAEYVASKAITDRIDAQSKMPGAEVSKPDGTKTTVDPAATEQQKMEARLEGSEIKIETMVNSILLINEGPDAKAVGKAPSAPTDINGRLTNAEKLMDVVENQMGDIAIRYKLIYDPYVKPASSEATSDQDRMATIENRYIHMNKMLKRLIKNAEADAEESE